MDKKCPLICLAKTGHYFAFFASPLRLCPAQLYNQKYSLLPDPLLLLLLVFQSQLPTLLPNQHSRTGTKFITHLNQISVVCLVFAVNGGIYDNVGLNYL